MYVENFQLKLIFLSATIPPYLNSVILVNPYEPPVAHYVMPPMFSRLMKKEPSALFPLIFQYVNLYLRWSFNCCNAFAQFRAYFFLGWEEYKF